MCSICEFVMREGRTVMEQLLYEKEQAVPGKV